MRWPIRLVSTAWPTCAKPRARPIATMTTQRRIRLSLRFCSKIFLITGFSSQASTAVRPATTMAQAMDAANPFQRGAR